MSGMVVLVSADLATAEASQLRAGQHCSSFIRRVSGDYDGPVSLFHNGSPFGDLFAKKNCNANQGNSCNAQKSCNKQVNATMKQTMQLKLAENVTTYI